MPLSKYHRNDLFIALKSSSVPIDEFELRDDYAQVSLILGTKSPIPVTVLHHRGSGSMFAILETRGLSKVPTYYVQQQIGAAKPSILDHWIIRKVREVRWEDIALMIRQWAGMVEQQMRRDQEYEDTPNLWEEYVYRSGDYFTHRHARDHRNTRERGQDYSNAPFDGAEQAQISEQIQQIKTYIRTMHDLTDEQFSKIESRLDHAEEASRRMGRKDWLVLFYGAVSSAVFSDLIPQQTVHQVILMVIHGLGDLFGIGGPPYLPPSG